MISAIQNGKTKMWLKYRTMNRNFVLFFFFFVCVDQKMCLFLERKWDHKDVMSAVVVQFLHNYIRNCL